MPINLDGVELTDSPAPKRTTSRTKKGSSNAELEIEELEQEPRREPVRSPRPRKRAPATTVRGVTASQREALKGMASVALGSADLFAHALFPKVWTQEDRLKDYEGKLLVDGLWAEVSMYPRLVEWLLKLSSQTSGHAQLAGALTLVSLPRLANHGLLPPELAKMASYFALQLATLGANSFPMESRSAPNGHSGDGTGEVHTNGVAQPTTEVQDSPSVEARRSGVETRTNGVSRILHQDS